MKITMELSPKQTEVVMKSLDLYSRILAGQFYEVANLFKPFNSMNSEVRELSNKFKELLLPDLVREFGNSAYLGIYSKDIGENAKIAYDIIQVARFTLAWNKNTFGGITVDFNTPLQASDTEDLPIVTIKEDSKKKSILSETQRRKVMLQAVNEQEINTFNKVLGIIDMVIQEGEE